MPGISGRFEDLAISRLVRQGKGPAGSVRVEFPGDPGTGVLAILAVQPAELAEGMMFRPEFPPPYKGMYFQFPSRSIHRMWMRNTPLPLDMIFLDDNKVIGIVHDAKPYTDDVRGPDVSSEAVLEVPSGFVEANKIKVGDSVKITIGVKPADTDGSTKTAEFAPGIEDKSRFESIRHVYGEPESWNFVIQRHDALHAGPHIDLRLGDPSKGHGHSWATKKLPEPGKSTYLMQQPTHDLSYFDFEGKIEKGYGAGTVSADRKSTAEVLKAGPEEIRFALLDGKIPEQFAMRRQPSSGGKLWTITNMTPTRSTGKWGKLVPAGKPSLKAKDISDVDPSDEDTVLQPKLDGAHAVAVLEGGKPTRFFSYREAKNKTGLIEHTFRMPDYWKNVAPRGMRPTVIRGEIWGSKNGKPIPAHEVGGLLNSAVPVSREKQLGEGVRLHFSAFDVERLDGRKKTLPPEVSRQFLSDISRQVKGIEVMPTAVSPKEKQRLLDLVRSGKHPMTREGVIERSRSTSEVVKAKLQDTYDVFVREVYPGARKGEAGGFRYSWTPSGPVVGNIGSGFTRDQRRGMLSDPEGWIGRVMKIRAQEKLPSGALRSPVLEEPHESKGLQPFHELG